MGPVAHTPWPSRLGLLGSQVACFGMEPACRRTGWEVRCTCRLFLAISGKRQTGWEVRCLVFAAMLLLFFSVPACRRTGWEVRCTRRYFFGMVSRVHQSPLEPCFG